MFVRCPGILKTNDDAKRHWPRVGRENVLYIIPECNFITVPIIFSTEASCTWDMIPQEKRDNMT